MEASVADKFERTLYDLKGDYQWIGLLGWSDDDLRRVPVHEEATSDQDYINLSDWGGNSLGVTSRPDASPASGDARALRNIFVYSSEAPRDLYERLRKLIESNPTQSGVESAFGKERAA